MKKLIITILLSIVILTGGDYTVASERIADASAMIAAYPKAEIANRISYRDIAREHIEQKKAIATLLKRYNSPLLPSLDAFMGTCITHNLDCYLLPSITGLESSFGQYTHPNSYNPFGWGGGYIMFKNWDEAIEAVGNGLRTNYINKGADDVHQIGRIYAASPTWAVRVERFIGQFEQIEKQDELNLAEISL